MKSILLVGTRIHHARSLARYRDAATLAAANAHYAVSGPASQLFLNQAESISSYLGVPWMPFEDALKSRWDLVIYSIHVDAQFEPPTKRIFIGHGIDCGDLAPNGCHTWKQDFGYEQVVAKSSVERQRAIRFQPRLESILQIIGDPLVDELQAMDRSRQSLRTQMGIAPHEVVVGLMSSWGAGSRVLPWLTELERRRSEIPSQVRIVLFSHPNNFLMAGTGRLNFQEMEKRAAALGILCVSPLEEFLPHLAICDAAVAGDSSIALYFSQLGRPLFYAGQFAATDQMDSPLCQLASFAPRVESIVEFCRDALLRAIDGYPQFRLRQLARSVIERPGRGMADLATLFSASLGTEPALQAAA